ncbi:hypothetical protein M9458_019478, partial [Cirrhinus mrigala]
RFELTDGSTKPTPNAVLSVEPVNGDHAGQAAVTLNIANQNITFQVPSGTRPIRPPNSSPAFIGTPTHDRLLAEMMQSHLVKDICLIGAKVHRQLPVATLIEQMHFELES